MQRRIAIFVIFLVVVHVIAATNAGHPCGVGAIPIDRLTEAVFQRDLWFPVELALGLVALQRVAPVVAWAILHVREQRFGLADQSQQLARDRQVFNDVGAAEIVNLADAATFEN